MRRQDDGDLEVSIGEVVTVETTATDTAFLAHTGPIQMGQWESIDRPNPLVEIRCFTVNATFTRNFSFVIGFDFSPGVNGLIAATAQYRTRITGSGPGGTVRERITTPTSILPTTRVFSFEVGQG
jgi:hypothetical protein